MIFARHSLLVFLAWAAAGCRTVATVRLDLPVQLQAKPKSYIAGPVTGLGPLTLLNNEDFVYTVASSDDSKAVALSRMGAKNFYLSLFSMGSAVPSADVPINVTDFDVEALAFSPDGKTVAATSRDGSLRLYDAANGTLLSSWLTDEPLLSVAFHPTQAYLVVGSAKGLLSALAWPRLALLGEARAHSDEVRAVAFTPDGKLLSGGWDKTLKVFSATMSEAQAASARLPAERKEGLLRLRAVVSDRVSATFVLDARSADIAITPQLAQTLGLQLEKLNQTRTINTPSGPVVATVVPGVTLRLKTMSTAPLEVVVCGACVPAGAQGVLGQSFLSRFTFAHDERTQEVVLTSVSAASLGPATSQVALEPLATHTLPAFLNDFSVDARGQRLGLALSETKAERNREIYEREKRKEVEPERPWDCAAVFDLGLGKIVGTQTGHRGVVSSVGISPDGQTLASGGWDKQVLLHREGGPDEVQLGWSARRVRFSPDGRWLLIAAWTPQNPLGDKKSDPSGLLYELGYGPNATVVERIAAQAFKNAGQTPQQRVPNMACPPELQGDCGPP